MSSRERRACANVSNCAHASVNLLIWKTNITPILMCRYNCVRKRNIVRINALFVWMLGREQTAIVYMDTRCEKPPIVRVVTGLGTKRHNSRVEVVVVTELFSFFDGTFGEDADAPLTQDVPLLNLAVGVAAVVDEPVRVCTCEERASGDGKGDG
jgi:hypothetical protein